MLYAFYNIHTVNERSPRFRVTMPLIVMGIQQENISKINMRISLTSVRQIFNLFYRK